MSGGSSSTEERVALLALLLEASTLFDDLGWWEPVGGLREALLLAVRGEGGLSSSEIARLRAWAARWSLVGSGLRALHRRGGTLSDPPETLSRSAWRILAYPERVLSDVDRRTLRSLYRTFFGHDPSFEVEPLLPPLSLARRPDAIS